MVANCSSLVQHFCVAGCWWALQTTDSPRQTGCAEDALDYERTGGEVIELLIHPNDAYRSRSFARQHDARYSQETQQTAAITTDRGLWSRAQADGAK